MRLLRRRSRAAHPTSVLAAVVLAAAACASPGDPTDGPATDPGQDGDARIAAVLELRATVGPPAAEFGSAAVTLEEQLAELRAELPLDTAERREAIADVRAGALAELEQARAAAGPELAGDATGPDAVAVEVALTRADDAAGALVEAAEADLAILELAADADERLAAIVTAWEEPGARSQQLARLDEAAAAGDALASELGAIPDVPDCSTGVARRAERATAAAEASRELRSLVERRRGEEFDARRRELALGRTASIRTLVDGDRTELDCWRDEGPVAEHAGAVAVALDDLEAALNPADLAAPDDA